MNMLALLNPALDDDERMPAAPHSTELAAMSLMLLGAREQDHKQDYTAPTLSIAAARSSENNCASADGLTTPLATSTATALPSTSVNTVIPATTAPSARTAAPHMSPVADKHQHVAAWGVVAASKSALQHARPSSPPREPSKRPRRECVTRHIRSKINDLFSSSRSDPPNQAPASNNNAKCIAAVAKASKTSQSSVATISPDHHKQRQAAHSGELSHDDLSLQGSNGTSETLPPGQYCVVAGCLRVAHEMSKCTLHKGLKLCSASGCFRPVQSRGFCKSHGGGARCKHPDCAKGAISKGRCRTHGGGTRCAIPSCSKWAQRLGCCVRHSKAFVATTPASSNRAVVHV